MLDNPTNAELNLLEILLHETYEVVDWVFIVESNCTCSDLYLHILSNNTSAGTINGTPKPFYFGEMRFND